MCGTSVKDLVSEFFWRRSSCRQHICFGLKIIFLSDSAPPGSHIYLTILTPNTTFPFLSCLSSLTSLLLLPPFSHSLFLLPFYLLALLTLSGSPIVKCKHDWAPEPEGFDSHQLLCASHTPSWHRPGSLTSQAKTYAAGKGDGCLRNRPQSGSAWSLRWKPSPADWWKNIFN